MSELQSRQLDRNSSYQNKVNNGYNQKNVSSQPASNNQYPNSQSTNQRTPQSANQPQRYNKPEAQSKEKSKKHFVRYYEATTSNGNKLIFGLHKETYFQNGKVVKENEYETAMYFSKRWKVIRPCYNAKAEVDYVRSWKDKENVRELSYVEAKELIEAQYVANQWFLQYNFKDLRLKRSTFIKDGKKETRYLLFNKRLKKSAVYMLGKETLSQFCIFMSRKSKAN